MDDEPQAPDERPKIFRNMTAWIGGATGVVIALGGLGAAYRQLMPQTPVQAAATNGDSAPAAAPANENAATAASVEADDPWYYTTDDGGTLRWVGGMWVETSATGGKTRYNHQSSGDGTTVALNPGGGENGADLYLRWRTAGGPAQKSADRQASWTDAYNVTVDDPARPAEGSAAN